MILDLSVRQSKTERGRLKLLRSPMDLG